MATASPTFISYAREDSEFAVTLARDLRKAGANIWLDQFDIPVGQNWPRAVQQALDSCGSFLVILSPASVESENVSAELDFALDEGKRIFPVLHRPCKRPFRIRAVQYADFTRGYQSGVAELIKALGVQPQEADSAARIEARASDAAHAAAIAKGRENSATLFRDGDLTGAIALLDKLIKDYPENASLRADRDAVASELARRQQAEARVQEKSERQLNPHSFPVAEPAGMDRQVATGTVRVSSAPHETRKPPVSAPAAPKVKSLRRSRTLVAAVVAAAIIVAIGLFYFKDRSLEPPYLRFIVEPPPGAAVPQECADRANGCMVARFLPRVKAIPGVRSAALLKNQRTFSDRGYAFATASVSASSGSMTESELAIVTADYLGVVGLPLRIGRNFHDGDSNVSILSESLWTSLWPDRSPFAIGSVVTVTDNSTGFNNQKLMVVGVTDDTSRSAANRLYVMMAPDSNSGANLIVQYFAPTSAEKTRLQDAIARTAQTLMFQLSPLK